MFLLDPFKEKLFWNLLKSLEMVLFLEHQAAAAARALARYLPWYANLIWRVHVRFTLVIISCWEGPQKLSLPLWVFFFFSFRQMWNLPFFMLIGWLGFYKQPKRAKIWKKRQNFGSHIIICFNQRQNQLVTAIQAKWNTQPFLLYYFYFLWITFVFLRGCEWVTTCDRA